MWNVNDTARTVFFRPSHADRNTEYWKTLPFSPAKDFSQDRGFVPSCTAEYHKRRGWIRLALGVLCDWAIVASYKRTQKLRAMTLDGLYLTFFYDFFWAWEGGGGWISEMTVALCKHASPISKCESSWVGTQRLYAVQHTLLPSWMLCLVFWLFVWISLGLQLVLIYSPNSCFWFVRFSDSSWPPAIFVILPIQWTVFT